MVQAGDWADTCCLKVFYASCRYLVEDTSSEWVGAEGNPVKAYAMGESATAELGPALSSFDDRVGHSCS